MAYVSDMCDNRVYACVQVVVVVVVVMVVVVEPCQGSMQTLHTATQQGAGICCTAGVDKQAVQASEKAQMAAARNAS